MTPILVRFFAAIGRPLRNAALANSLTVTPEGNSPFARLWWSNADGEPRLIRTHNPPWTRPLSDEMLAPGGRYLVNPGVTPLRLPLLGDGELIELRPDYDKNWSSAIAQLIPSAGWTADPLPTVGKSLVHVVADQATHHYWAWSIPLEDAFNSLTQRVDALEGVDAGIDSRFIATTNEAIARESAIIGQISVEASSRAAADASAAAFDAANYTLVQNQIAAEAVARSASDTASANAASANYATIQGQLAAEASARIAASQQPFELTTDAMTLEKFKSYTVSAGHTVSFPVMASNEWIRAEPANSDWYSVAATLNLPAGWTFDPPTLNGVEPNAVLLFIANASTLKLRVRQ